uniref:Uncharacterized protein n=1 Tax=Klebsiella pneumoniae TaxID=573 RepID=A0A8B0STU7_KLEPN|nr:hypothetical protein [Klebsiella pneumoniae]
MSEAFLTVFRWWRRFLLTLLVFSVIRVRKWKCVKETLAIVSFVYLLNFIKRLPENEHQCTSCPRKIFLYHCRIV